MGVAIIGMGEREIPSNMELWGMPWDSEWVMFDTIFEMHDPANMKQDHKDRLNEAWVPLYMQEQYQPNATKYPLEEVINITGDYFSCSICYMIGLAILRDLPSIEIHGVSGDENYKHQKPAIEYMLGVARGRGMKVDIHGGSLLKQDTRYGYN